MKFNILLWLAVVAAAVVKGVVAVLAAQDTPLLLM
jgi:hypothetical protein